MCVVVGKVRSVRALFLGSFALVWRSAYLSFIVREDRARQNGDECLPTTMCAQDQKQSSQKSEGRP